MEAVQTGRVTLDELQHELEAGPSHGRRQARLAIEQARAGVWSVPEADLLRMCADSAMLPHAWPNPVLRSDGRRLISPDLWFDDVALAVMVHSRQHHERDADWEGTVERDGELTAHGACVIGFTPRSIATRPRDVLSRIEQTYEVLRGRARPPIQMTPRGWGAA